MSTVTLDRLFGGPEGICDLPAFRDQQFNSGQYIAERGLVPDRIFTVKHGVAVMEANDDDDDYKARLLCPREVVGLVETLACRPFSYSVVASTECTVLSITRSDLVRHIADRPELRSRAVRLLADLVRDADRLLKQL